MILDGNTLAKAVLVPTGNLYTAHHPSGQERIIQAKHTITEWFKLWGYEAPLNFSKEVMFDMPWTKVTGIAQLTNEEVERYKKWEEQATQTGNNT